MVLARVGGPGRDVVVLWPFELVTIVNDDSVVAAEALLVVGKARCGGMRRVACLALWFC